MKPSRHFAIACCAEHGLQLQRASCYVCDGPVTEVVSGAEARRSADLAYCYGLAMGLCAAVVPAVLRWLGFV